MTAKKILGICIMVIGSAQCWAGGAMDFEDDLKGPAKFLDIYNSVGRTHKCSIESQDFKSRLKCLERSRHSKAQETAIFQDPVYQIDFGNGRAAKEHLRLTLDDINDLQMMKCIDMSTPADLKAMKFSDASIDCLSQVYACRSKIQFAEFASSEGYRHDVEFDIFRRIERAIGANRKIRKHNYYTSAKLLRTCYRDAFAYVSAQKDSEIGQYINIDSLRDALRDTMAKLQERYPEKGDKVSASPTDISH